ncbi:Glutathione peroxidase 2 [Tilletia horrida]|uniref:Glutathione peroxidase n=1 Tax=Tilletia horrida TaxID=155126 RepID=A0AAN6JPD0_9BASI|nr:Glutathione peroxidase 2 [Tilletia horrida]KAK0543419.1 Glutathione peroxidase 2 [Tilletia horrida]KAK0559833.1 Glutathione peroxidase 2 [Tilletia horrida]
MTDFYQLKAKKPAGDVLDFNELRGKTVLIVNTASKCGFASQLEELEHLNKRYKDDGLVVIGFPTSQFKQELSTDAEISHFCTKASKLCTCQGAHFRLTDTTIPCLTNVCLQNYGVSFPIVAKSEVNGRNSNEVFAYLKKQSKGIFGTSAIKWNYTKFLVDKNGKVQRFSPITKPKVLTHKIEVALKA